MCVFPGGPRTSRVVYFFELQGKSSNPLESLFDICAVVSEGGGEGLGELKAPQAVDVLG